ncbi:hypothetical protein CKO28_20485 [Rhodovibrio sodomensis]|uniref:DUF4158 domain-containing protein n=1 Tax=Rhodovibrio sodomensis TaxID=1088 RepID=A0ABS1DIS4_9PROT|nr:hypothetical protein [Rhodovibrio sodomensis]MBK1670405.1 hypothetical protein [Rhodovibrio sodomensis]
MPKTRYRPAEAVRYHAFNGEVIDYASLHDFVRQLPRGPEGFRLIAQIGLRFRRLDCFGFALPDPRGEAGSAVLRDLWGDSIPRSQVHEAWASVGPKPIRLRAHQAAFARAYRFRDGPVPRTGRHGGGSYFRRPRTTAEIRAWDDALDAADEAAEYGGTLRLRRRRGPKALPEAWDDIPRGDHDHRCWKRHRRTQYRTRA